MNFYQVLSRYYDDIFPATKAELDFIKSAARGGAGSVIVDIGCGTGSHCIALAEEGYTAYGFDLESDMIEKAKGKAERLTLRGAATFTVADMLDIPFADCSSDLVMSIGNTLAHLGRISEVEKALREMRRIAKPSGPVLIQTVNYDKVIKMGSMELRDITIPGDNILFRRIYQLLPDGKVVFRSSLEQEGKAFLQSEVPMYPLTRDVLVECMTRQGYGGIEVFGNFMGEGYDSGSPSLVITARRD